MRSTTLGHQITPSSVYDQHSIVQMNVFPFCLLKRHIGISKQVEATLFLNASKTAYKKDAFIECSWYSVPSNVLWEGFAVGTSKHCPL